MDEDNEGGPRARDRGGVTQRGRVDLATSNPGQDLVEGDALRKLLNQDGAIYVPRGNRWDVSKAPLKEQILGQTLAEDGAGLAGGCDFFFMGAEDGCMVQSPVDFECFFLDPMVIDRSILNASVKNFALVVGFRSQIDR